MSEKKHNEALNKADLEVASKMSAAGECPYRLKYHFMPPIGWMNDPNGFVQFDGEYHLFFQFNPYSSTWGPIHWGHATSKDLVIWKHQPVALAPSEFYDFSDDCIHGCASGCAVIDKGNLILLYTGHVETRSPMQVQCIASSNDGIHFIKNSYNPVIYSFPKDGSKDFRDPKVWRYQDSWYMIVGTKQDDIGKIVMYTSNNLLDWTYIGVTAESNGSQGDMWECPDLFPLNDRDILIISPIKNTKNLSPFYMIGNLDYKNNRFRHEIEQTLDYGFDFYAPQTMIDEKGRRILIAWMESWLSVKPSQKNGWAGAMTIPRILELDTDGYLRQKPLDELTRIRSNHKHMGPFEAENFRTLMDCGESVSETIVEFDLNKTTAKIFEFQVRCSQDGEERTVIRIDLLNNEISMDRDNAGCGEKGISKAPLPYCESGILKLHIFLDASSIELFINDGLCVITNRIYPQNDSIKCNIIPENGKVFICGIDNWTLCSIWE